MSTPPAAPPAATKTEEAVEVAPPPLKLSPLTRAVVPTRVGSPVGEAEGVAVGSRVRTAATTDATETPVPRLDAKAVEKSSPERALVRLEANANASAAARAGGRVERETWISKVTVQAPWAAAVTIRFLALLADRNEGTHSRANFLIEAMSRPSPAATADLMSSELAEFVLFIAITIDTVNATVSAAVGVTVGTKLGTVDGSKRRPSVHNDAPAVDVYPTEQSAQVAAPEPEYVAAGHVLQAEDAIALVKEEYLPAMHRTQTRFPAYWPAGQDVDIDVVQWLEPSVEKYPSAQFMQTLAPPPAYVFAGQYVQTLAPVDA